VYRGVHQKNTEICTIQKYLVMSFGRVLLAIIFPPLTVLDKGCGSLLLVCILTLCGWVPGVIAALVILNNPKYNK
jgi:uncharacterized membrane protein YqaE (UPF0057 family)